MSPRYGFNAMENEHDDGPLEVEGEMEEPNFRCPGCELNNGTGRYCAACLDELRPADDPPGGYHPPSTNPEKTR